MDVVVPVQNKICSNNLSTPCYTAKMFSLSSYKNCERNCSSSDRSYRRRSFNSSLHSIDETDTLDFQRSRKRELSTSNNYPEKRQSDPLLHCAFTNKGFDIDVNNHTYFSMYDKLLDTFSYVRHHQTVEYPKKNRYPTPKIKVRISDECGNRIDNSLDSQSDSEVDESWNFGAAEIRCDDGDAFNIRNEEINRPTTVNKCRKCGHKYLKTQFSTTFS